MNAYVGSLVWILFPLSSLSHLSFLSFLLFLHFLRSLFSLFLLFFFISNFLLFFSLSIFQSLFFNFSLFLSLSSILFFLNFSGSLHSLFSSFSNLSNFPLQTYFPHLIPKFFPNLPQLPTKIFNSAISVINPINTHAFITVIFSNLTVVSLNIIMFEFQICHSLQERGC